MRGPRRCRQRHKTIQNRSQFNALSTNLFPTTVLRTLPSLLLRGGTQKRFSAAVAGATSSAPSRRAVVGSPASDREALSACSWLCPSPVAGANLAASALVTSRHLRSLLFLTVVDSVSVSPSTSSRSLCFWPTRRVTLRLFDFAGGQLAVRVLFFALLDRPRLGGGAAAGTPVSDSTLLFFSSFTGEVGAISVSHSPLLCSWCGGGTGHRLAGWVCFALLDSTAVRALLLRWCTGATFSFSI